MTPNRAQPPSLRTAQDYREPLAILIGQTRCSCDNGCDSRCVRHFLRGVCSNGGWAGKTPEISKSDFDPVADLDCGESSAGDPGAQRGVGSVTEDYCLVEGKVLSWRYLRQSRGSQGDLR